MKFDFTEEHEALRALLADLRGDATMGRVVYDSDDVIDRRLWESLRDLGLLGVGVPEAYEGGGAGPVEQVVIAEELGRTVAAVPFTEHSAAAAVVAQFGSDDQRRQLLVPLARGEAVGGIVLAGSGSVTTRRDGSQWRLDGTVPLVPNAAAATLLAVAARVDNETRWFVTTAATITALPTVDRSRPAATVEFTGAEAKLLADSRSSTRPRDLLWTLAAAEAAGAASSALDRTARYATERHQFGVPIGTFQAVKHLLADMLVAVENSRSAVYGAAWALAEDGQTERSAALAQAVATQNAISVVSDAVQLHGGIGVTWECDLHLFLRRSKALEATYGSPARHRASIATALLGG
ncbi:acyl-CoA/acyl-ACP dehydrogenase [Mycobacterium sp. CVI_P3]|uniref:Acyl-CoA/acyl-ACP dehydrogenase n=1 Tax=Mycobacterium pinniadriaticum TaxID=2994102 RepID=A0ABT3SD02_9MYCO|nr:acyl-CoA dehydrogenase family protein [Mycobacterium pinniadriaticum]MCX2930594.1 acyl-CoA/acyl-ACP dehydrogenase [Mycobacterium pinniadriaticum]MCX2937018.1 acyl-CoA/acyl-ACP dehydrogenase [Mycobacterium pinniadriaticum]